MQRARGFARFGFVPGCDGPRLTDLRQQGCAKLMLPKVHGPVPEAVFLNTAGGLTGGDRLTLTGKIGDGCHVTATTQTAERGYASASGAASVYVDFAVGADARLDWLPQETILFDRAAIDRKTRIDLGPGAEVLLAETICLGRHAMGETVHELALTDRREVTRGGSPVWLDPLRLNSADGEFSSVARLGSNRVISTIALVAQGAEDGVEPLLARLEAHPDLMTAVSGWDGRLVARLASRDLFPLKRALVAALTHLRGVPMPRVWQV